MTCLNTPNTNTCAKPPIPCSNTNTTLVNNFCSCGLGVCASTNVLCNIKNNQCIKLGTCAVTDASKINTSACTCGTKTCNGGVLCLGNVNLCGAPSLCKIINGTQINAAACTCGEAVCLENQLCDSMNSLCSTPLPTCKSVNSAALNSVACQCGASPCQPSQYCNADANLCSGGKNSNELVKALVAIIAL